MQVLLCDEDGNVLQTVSRSTPVSDLIIVDGVWYLREPKWLRTTTPSLRKDEQPPEAAKESGT